jgi:hypothetical protein
VLRSTTRGTTSSLTRRRTKRHDWRFDDHHDDHDDHHDDHDDHHDDRAPTRQRRQAGARRARSETSTQRDEQGRCRGASRSRWVEYPRLEARRVDDTTRREAARQR